MSQYVFYIIQHLLIVLFYIAILFLGLFIYFVTLFFVYRAALLFEYVVFLSFAYVGVRISFWHDCGNVYGYYIVTVVVAVT
jgi:hypothetical protein